MKEVFLKILLLIHVPEKTALNDIEKGGLQRPISVTFSPDGKDMYVVDFGVLGSNNLGFLPKKQSGVIWKITRSEQRVQK